MAFVRTLPGLLHAWFPAWTVALLSFVAIVAVGLAIQSYAMAFLTRRAQKWHPFLRHVFAKTNRVGRFAVVLLALVMTIPLIPLSDRADRMVHHVVIALFIALIGWMALVAANIAIDRYEQGLKLDASDNLMARKAATQMRIFRQAINILLGLLTIAFALMNFDAVRQFGISLFASAGIAGLVAGMAARPMLENLIAGVQLALTQPLRLGDAVVIANEWGWVEEIGSVYIVVRLWDWRRQIVPLSYLFQTPFTNWTRSSSSIIGTVLIYADYTLPMAPVRQKAEEIVRASPLWDGQVVNVQVSDAKEHVMEVRILASGTDGSRVWDLRCEVREKLIAFIQDNYPGSLPHMRREEIRLPGEPAAPAGLPTPARPI